MLFLLRKNKNFFSKHIDILEYLNIIILEKTNEGVADGRQQGAV